jgi:hypothetical protein
MRRPDPTLRPHRRNLAVALVSLGLMACLTACETPLERAYGLSQRQHIARTIENPDAGIEDLEARRPDGASTEAALIRYREGESKTQDQAPPDVINIDIGG